MRTILLVVVLIIIAIVAIFYFALHTKTKVVSNELPFAKIIGHPLVTERDALLVKNLQQYSFENIYLLTETTATTDIEIIEKHFIPKGTTIIFNKAKLYRNGVSGSVESVLTGTIAITPQQSYPFEYVWGNRPFLTDKNINPYWVFPAALWQSENDTTKYYLPEF